LTQRINDSLISSYLDQLLSVHWLRPETALWRVFDNFSLLEKQA
jgi:hypothetical protein